MCKKHYHNSTAFFTLLLFISFTFACSKDKIEFQNIPESMALVPKGFFIMGSDNIKNPLIDKGEYKLKAPLYADEYPKQKMLVNDFLMDKFEVTNKKFWMFNNKYKYIAGKDNHPVSNVSWFEANKYCESLEKRLPTIAEWEKAARGLKGNIYPWGNEYDPQYANTARSNQKGTKPVGLYEKGKSIYGIYDLIGNVSEWTNNWYKPYIGSDFKNNKFGEKYKEIRGSSWGGDGHFKLPAFDRASYRRSSSPGKKISDVGFRCVKEVK